MKIHPGDLVLEEFFLSQGEEEQILLAHLVRCARCSLRFQGVIDRTSAVSAGGEEGMDIPANGYESILDRGETLAPQEVALAKERSAAPGLFVELMRLAPEQQRLLIRNSPRFRIWGLSELLLERCLETTVKDPAGAEDLGLLALEVAARLDSTHYRGGLLQDLQARAWSCLGNARRVRADLRGAEDAFSKAEAFLYKGSRDPLDYAIFLDLKASLWRARRRFDEALTLLQRAVTIFRRIGHYHRAGKSLVTMDTIHCYAGHPERGIPLLYQAIELIDSDREPRLLLCARHNLIHDLTETGRFLEAQRLYGETRSLYREFPDAVTQNRRRWVKGKISYGLGRISQGERLLLTARDGFIADGISYDTALVSLELAALYARQGRTADLKRLAQEMLPIFSALQIHREALAALCFLRKALETERASLELVSRVADFLRRAEHDPGLRFVP